MGFLCCFCLFYGFGAQVMKCEVILLISSQLLKGEVHLYIGFLQPCSSFLTNQFFTTSRYWKNKRIFSLPVRMSGRDYITLLDLDKMLIWWKRIHKQLVRTRYFSIGLLEAAVALDNEGHSAILNVSIAVCSPNVWLCHDSKGCGFFFFF